MGDWSKWAAKVDGALRPTPCPPEPDAALRPGEFLVLRVNQPLEAEPEPMTMPEPITIEPIAWIGEFDFPRAAGELGVGLTRQFAHQWVYDQFITKAIAECQVSLNQMFNDIAAGGFKMLYYSQIRASGEPIRPLSESSRTPVIPVSAMQRCGVVPEAAWPVPDGEADSPLLVAAQDFTPERGLPE